MHRTQPDARVAPYLEYLDQQLSKGRPRLKAAQSSAVFARLHPHSSQTSVGLTDPSIAASPRSGRIEEVLMQRHRQAQSKLTQLKAKVQAEELRELKSAPSINPLSRRIADLAHNPRMKPGVSTGKTQKRALILDSKITHETDHTASSFVSPKSESTVSPPMELRCHVSLLSGATSPIFPSARLTNTDQIRFLSDQKITSIEALRKTVMERYKSNEPIEPPPDILEMQVLERQDYFVEQRSRKMQQKRIQKAEDEVRGCTFRPDISRSLSATRRSLEDNKRSVSSSKLKTSSYYERYLYAKSVRESLNQSSTNGKPMSRDEPLQDVKVGKREKKEVGTNYHPLSPTSQHIGFKSGMNMSQFLSQAKPMLNYRNMDINRAMTASKSTRAYRG